MFAVGIYIAGISIVVSSVIGQDASGIARSFLGGKGALKTLVAVIKLFIGLPLAIFVITMVARLAGKFRAPSIAEKLSRADLIPALQGGGSLWTVHRFPHLFGFTSFIWRAVRGSELPQEPITPGSRTPFLQVL